MLWWQLLKRLLTLDCASCEGFSTSRNAFFISKEHAAGTEVAYNPLDGMNCLAMGTIYYPWSFSSFAEHGLHAYTLPPPRWAHLDSQKKTGSRLIGRWRRLRKPSMGSCGQGWAANRTQYIFSPEMSSHDHACAGHGSLATCSQVVNTAGLHSLVVFKPKKFDLVQQTVFLLRGVVWAQD